MPVHQEFQYRVSVLGPVSVDGPDGLVDPGGHKPRLLLSLLVAKAGAMVSTERLIDGLWGDAPPVTARKAIHVHVSNLRRNLGERFPLETTRAGYRLDCDQLVIDAVRFESGVARGRALLEASPAEAADLLTLALQLWNGPAYADLGDEEAIRPEALRLTDLRLSAIELRIEADLRLGRHDAVLSELETLTIDNPFRERLRELQMLALYRSGRQADALRTFDRTRTLLAEELGVDPSPALRLLHQRILEQSDDLDQLTGGSGASTAAGSQAGPVRRTIRGYELRERLGGRGDGCVYRAYHATRGREVALRLMPPPEANSPTFVKQFDAACELIADLDHPHIVSVNDYWRDPDGACVAMPLMRGGSLEASLQRSLWHAPAALRLIEQVGSALAYAHRRGVAHGDVRASNVLLDEDGNGYLSDFVLDGRAVGCQAGRSVSVHDDIQGLAAITCTMLAGASPHDASYARNAVPAGLPDLVRTATDPNLARRFRRVEDFLRAMRQCLGADSVSTLQSLPRSEPRNPFKGLRAFRETDAGDFFGRDELVRELLDRVSNHGLTTVIGPSGSGKSSLVRAGLVPACRARGLDDGRDLVIAEMLPGRYPFEELESALMAVAIDRPSDLLAELSADEQGLVRAAKRILPDDNTDLLLIVDQFEELFALTSDDAIRRAFLANLCSVARDDHHRVRAVLTLRADFFDRPLLYPLFGELMKESITAVALPGESSLAEAIGEPARRVGLEIEPGLIPTVLRDVADQPGSLPMLQYALTELVEIREGDRLTIEAYRRTGGVIGALATRAEEIFESLTPPARDVARDVFVRLVSVGDETDDTRRRVRRTELETLGVELTSLETVIDAFGSFRLLTFDHDPVTRGPTVEVAHEALIREWPRYRRWIDERRDDLRAERRLASATIEWLASDRDTSFVIGGGQLERFETWIEDPPVRLTADERAFIEASRDDEARRRKRMASRRRRGLVGAALLSAAAMIAAAVALNQRDRAGDEARAANDAAAVADGLRSDAEGTARIARAEAAMAEATTQSDPDLGILLPLAEHDALAAHGLSPPEAVTRALYQATFDHRIIARIPTGRDDVVPHYATVAANADGSMFASGSIFGSYVSIVDSRTGAVTVGIESERLRQIAATWNADGMLMVGDRDGVVEVFGTDGTPVRSFTVSPGRPVWPIMLGDGVIAVGEFPGFASLEFKGGGLGSFSLLVEDSATGDEIRRTPGVRKVVPSPSGNMVAAILGPGEIAVYDSATWNDITSQQLPDRVGTDAVVDFAWAPSGEALWVLSTDRLVKLDVGNGSELLEFGLGGDRAVFVAPSLDGRFLAVGGYLSPIRILDASSGGLLTELEADDEDELRSARYPFTVAWIGQRRLVVAQDDSTLIWDLGPPRAADRFWPDQAIVPVESWATPSGDRVLVASDGAVQVFDEDGELRSSMSGSDVPDASSLLSRDGSTRAVPNPDGVQFRDVASGALLSVADPGLSRALSLSDDGRLAIVGPVVRAPGAHRVEIVDTVTGEQLANLGGNLDAVRGDFTSDGRTAVVPTISVPMGVDEPRATIRVVDLRTGTTVATNGILRCVTSATISHDDSTVAVLGCDGELVLLDLTTVLDEGPWTGDAALIARVENDETPAVGVAFGPDDDLLVVSREDGRVEAYQVDASLARLWSFRVGEHVGAPEVRDGMVWVGTSYSLGDEEPSGGLVAMPVDPDVLVSLARTRVTRSLETAECERFLTEASC